MRSRQLAVDSRQESEAAAGETSRRASSPVNGQLPTANSRLELRITGFGGQGVVLAAHIIGRACIEAGRHATMIQSFGPEARGASCSATLVVSPDEVLYPYIQQPEILVAMSGDGYEKFKDELKPGGTLIYESDLVKPDPPLSTQHSALSTRPFGIPSTRIAETLKKPMVQNIVMLGFIARVTNLVPLETMRAVVRDSVPAGTEEINLQAFDAGAAYLQEVLEVV